jgi:hypothetical protein
VLDELTERYGDLLTGSYDCVDRIMLNAYFSLGHDAAHPQLQTQVRATALLQG